MIPTHVGLLNGPKHVKIKKAPETGAFSVYR